MNPQTHVPDPVFEKFLQCQHEEGMALARASDLLELHAHPFPPPNFVATFHCKGLVRTPDGQVAEGDCFQAGIWFPPDYLRRVDPFETLRWFGPQNIWHPNISDTLPLICVGRLTPGMPLVDILYQMFEIITYAKYTPREDDSLNKACCAWARQNQHRFPIDRRPLKRRTLGLEVNPT
jgi:ubiquitin-protein ligase